MQRSNSHRGTELRPHVNHCRFHANGCVATCHKADHPIKRNSTLPVVKYCPNFPHVCFTMSKVWQSFWCSISIKINKWRGSWIDTGSQSITWTSTSMWRAAREEPERNRNRKWPPDTDSNELRQSPGPRVVNPLTVHRRWTHTAARCYCCCQLVRDANANTRAKVRTVLRYLKGHDSDTCLFERHTSNSPSGTHGWPLTSLIGWRYHFALERNDLRCKPVIYLFIYSAKWANCAVKHV